MVHYWISSTAKNCASREFEGAPVPTKKLSAQDQDMCKTINENNFKLHCIFTGGSTKFGICSEVSFCVNIFLLRPLYTASHTHIHTNYMNCIKPYALDYHKAFSYNIIQ